MRLLELRANKTSFHTVTFNRSGVSVIVGRKKSQSTDKRNTYNSVGKSLIVRLIHFCLGTNEIVEFQKKLPGWQFSLDFELDGVKYTATRSTTEQDTIVLLNEKLGLKEFRKKFNGLFYLERKVKFLGFRPLISRFIRPKKSSYENYDNYIDKEEDYARLVNNAYLLGLDVGRVVKKIDLKVMFDSVEKAKKNADKDSILKSFFEGGKDVDIDIVDLEERIKHLEQRLSQFVIAEDLDIIRKDADEISANLRQHRNRATALQNIIRNIEKSLQINPDVSKKKIFKLYEDAKVSLNGMVVKQVEDVERFNGRILNNRIERLLEEKEKNLKLLNDTDVTIKKLGDELDEKLQYLNAHGALEEYAALNNQKANFYIKLAKLKSYKKLTNDYKNKLETIKIEFSGENISTNNYLDEAKPIIDKNISVFKAFAEQFYKDKKSGIEVLNNQGINKCRFDVLAKIQDDAGDGVNEVKIFCFDFTLLKARHNHKVDFIFHDGRILSDMDPRQRGTLFKLAFENTFAEGTQYIISANEDVLQSVKGVLSEEEFQKYVSDNVILELTDESHEAKLLGIQVDLDYELDIDRYGETDEPPPAVNNE